MDKVSTHSYAAPAATVLALMTDPDTLRAKYAALGHRDVEVVAREERADGSVTMRTRRTVPMDVPGFAKKVLSPTNRVEQEDVWAAPTADGACRGRWRVEARGVPVTVNGTVTVTPDGPHRCTVTVRADVACGIPLVGGRIAGFVADDVLRTVHGEEAFTDARLAAGTDR